MTGAVILSARAKLTWSLRITGVREDGYHLLDAEFVSLDLADVLHLTPGGNGLTVEGPYAAGVPTDGSNLALRALTASGRAAGIHLVKHIPAGGGLGGGSADAAAVLRWAGIDAPAVAAALGADVPFCVRGGRARVAGVGEVVEPLAPVARTVTLVVPPVAVSTPVVYRAWDELGGPRGTGPNDLEPAALVVAPRLAVWRDRIVELTGERPVLAGSGATWFLPGDHAAALCPLEAEGAAIVVTRTAETGGEVIERRSRGA